MTIAVAVILGLFEKLAPFANYYYKDDLERQFSTAIGSKIAIQELQTSWYRFVPVLKLKNVALKKADDSILYLNKLFLGVDLFASLYHRQILPTLLYLDNLNVELRQKNNIWYLENIPLGSFKDYPSSLGMNKENTEFLLWMLSLQKLIFKHLSLHIVLDDQTVIPIDNFSLKMKHQDSQYLLKITGKLTQTIPTGFTIIANLNIDSFRPQKMSGQIYLAVQDLELMQWRHFMPNTVMQLKGGQGNLQGWFKIKDAQVKNIQTCFDFKHVLVTHDHHNQEQFIPQLKGNIAWSLRKNGWSLMGDKIQLQMANQLWPENKVMIHYQANQQKYFIYLKNFVLDQFVSANTNLPGFLDFLKDYHMSGLVQNLQLQLQQNQVLVLLAQYRNLAFDFPGCKTLRGGLCEPNLRIENLSGAIHWQPESGKIQIDSQNMTIKPQDLPPIRALTVQVLASWKNTKEWVVEQLSLSHPNLLLQAKGSLIKELDKTKMMDICATSWIRHAERWLRYIPPSLIGYRLDNWLKHAVRRVENVETAVLIKGNIADFPYENKSGQFLVRSQLQGLDLQFDPAWPILNNINGNLQVDAATLSTTIQEAISAQIPLRNLEAVIKKLGSDQEILTLKIKNTTHAAKILRYIAQSPLQSKLAILQNIKMRGLLTLLLSVDLPLDDNDLPVAVQGKIKFHRNQALFSHALHDLPLADIQGEVDFDEKGILDSQLAAKILTHPITMLIQATRGKNPYSTLKMKGKMSIPLLNNYLESPLFTFMQGSFWLEGQVKITDDPADLDHLTIYSNMQGLTINLPPPLGKMKKIKAPLRISVDFNPEKAIRVRANYNQQLQSDLWFTGSSDNYQLKNGQVLLGASPKPAFWQGKPGVELRGNLFQFDVTQWLSLKAKMSQLATQPSAINHIYLNLQNAKIGQGSYKNLLFQADKRAVDGHWLIRILQAGIDAELIYEPQTNWLRGAFKKLFILHDSASAPLQKINSSLNPQQLPSLELKIANLKWNNIPVGFTFLQGHNINTAWVLDSLKIKNVFYDVFASGKWQRQGQLNKTQVQGKMLVHDMGKILSNFDIAQAVLAGIGTVKFQVYWLDSLLGFGYKKLNGQMMINIERGRIINLGAETEEKLGFGKLLSILSLQTIPRRLQLDFSDLANEGYSFDEFKGSFIIRNGLLHTNNSYIDGPVAYASLKGDLDLDKHLYNLDINISPYITASLPLVATLAGGPIAGIATWMADKLIHQGMQKISAYSYKITGPWQQPKIEQTGILM